MSFPEPFPEDILSEIREYPGNQKCCDCGSLDTDWGSVSHGTLICLDCAGKHRSLGVHISFVRSIRMDSWSRQQVEMMRQGGNQQIRRFFQKIEIENSPVQTLYCTKGASHYRERLRERVEKIMSGEIKSEKRVIFSPKKPLPNQLPKNNLNSIENGQMITTKGSSNTKTETFRIMFADGPMGMTLTKDSKDMALVSKLIPGGAAQSNGVKIGDHIIGVAGKSLENYDEIMHYIPCMSRPVEIQFSRIVRVISNPSENKPQNFHESKSDGNLSSNSHFSTSQSSKTPIAVRPSINLSVSEKIVSTDRISPTDSKAVTFMTSKGTNNPSSISPRSFTNEIYVKRPNGQSNNQSDEEEEEEDLDEDNLGDLAPTSLYARRGGQNGKWMDNAETSPSTTGSMSPAFSLSGPLDVSPVSSPGRIITSQPTDPNNHQQQLQFQSQQQQQLSQQKLQQKILKVGSEEDADRLEASLGASSAESDASVGKVIGFMLEAGAVVKVLRDGKWKSCIIRRQHRDGTFKVCFRDGSTESHVPTARMALSKAVFSFASAAAAAQASKEVLEEEAHAIAHSSSQSEELSGLRQDYHSLLEEDAGAGGQQDFKTTDFVVDSNVDMEMWMENDEGDRFDEMDEGFAGLSLRSKSYDPMRGKQPNAKSGLKSMSYDPQCSSSSGGGGGGLSVVTSGAYISLDDDTDRLTEGIPGPGLAADGECSIIELTFDVPPLGLTLSVGQSGEPEVTKTVQNGAAMRMGVLLGDVLIKVADSPVTDYDQAMEILPFCQYPLSLVFRRGKSKTESLFAVSGEAVLRNSKIIASKLMDTIGLTKQPTSLLHAPTATRLSNSRRIKDDESGKNGSSSSSSSSGTGSGTVAALSSRYLSSSVESDKEFDVTFEEPDLGFRIEERIGLETVSVVTQVSPNGPATERGVTVGCVVLGINFERYISHAHCVATLKYVKRPVTIRFRISGK